MDKEEFFCKCVEQGLVPCAVQCHVCKDIELGINQPKDKI